MNTLDQIDFHFSADSALILNICLGIIMYGVALSIRLPDFKAIFTAPRAYITGVVSQFLLLPLVTYLLVTIIKPEPSIALGMFLVAACPGGNISNFISLLARGNPALSVALTGSATLLAIVMTPLNFAFYGKLYPPTAQLLTEVNIPLEDVFQTVGLLLGLPLILGTATTRYFPDFSASIQRPIKILSIMIFGGFLVIAFASNWHVFTQYIHHVIYIVIIHNAMAFFSGYFISRILMIKPKERRTIAIETGIQNSGLALALIFTFFNGMGGMALVAGFWGIWHIIAGLTLAFIIGKQKDTKENYEIQ